VSFRDRFENSIRGRIWATSSPNSGLGARYRNAAGPADTLADGSRLSLEGESAAVTGDPGP
jgi:hypothetical protein